MEFHLIAQLSPRSGTELSDKSFLRNLSESRRSLLVLFSVPLHFGEKDIVSICFLSFLPSYLPVRSIILPFSLANFRNGSVNTMCIKSLSYLMRFRAHGRLFCQNALHCKVRMYSWTQLVYFTSSGGMFF